MATTKKIAVVDDDEIQTKALSEELRDAGFEVCQAYDGEAGLAVVMKEMPDLVLLDIRMPKMDGITVLKELKKSPTTKKIPVIIFTVMGTDDATLKAIAECEPAFYLIKADWQIKDIVKKVKEVLQLRY